MAFDLEGRRVWVAGHRGMVGSAVVRRLAKEPCEVLTVPRSKVDLRRQADVEDWVADNAPDAVIVAAAKVGGILANDTAPADFLYDNLIIETNIINASHASGVRKLLFLGSSCIYPKFAQQPIVEEALLTGPLEPTNEWYAIAKIAGIKLCEAFRRQYGADYISAMPTNLYGPEDNFDLRSSHVLPALMRKIHTAKITGARSVEIWGSGTVRREFMHVDDLADACVFLLKNYSDSSHINVGTGEDLTIRELAETIADIVGCDAQLQYDRSKPDGTPRKLMDSAKLTRLGWQPQIGLRAGIADTYAWFLANRAASMQQDTANAAQITA
jgi:GDP-L-fucose synthase